MPEIFNNTFMKPTLLLLTALSLACAPSLVAQSFYSGPTFFSQRPDETKSLTTIDRFGPVGMAIDLIHPVFTMRIKSIEEGSPAAATGRLKAGQIIESINGAPLKDIDPRIQLGNLITAAEAADGVLKFAIKGEAGPVSVKIQPML
jgi:C-terminal processing protease CtpA/Prc